MTPETLALRTPEHSNTINHGFITDTLRRPLAIATGVLAMAGITSLATNTERANGVPEICTAPSGEEPTPQTKPKVAGVDLMIYKPALASELCAVHQNTSSTFIENVGTKPARGVKFTFSGTSYIASGLESVRVDDKAVQIVEANQFPSNGEEFCERYLFNQDWTGARTVTLNCSYGFARRDLASGQKMKVEVALTPQRASNPTEVGGEEALYPKAPYVTFFAEDKITPETLPEDKNLVNNGVLRTVYVRDFHGNSSQKPSPICAPPTLTLKGSKISPSRKGVLTTQVQTKSKISGVGNGAHKDPRVRAKAARIVVTANPNTKIGKLPSDMRRIGTKVFIDIPASGVNKSLIDRIPFSFKGNGTSFSAKLYTPKGKVTNCSKAMTINSKALKSTSL